MIKDNRQVTADRSGVMQCIAMQPEQLIKTQSALARSQAAGVLSPYVCCTKPQSGCRSWQASLTSRRVSCSAVMLLICSIIIWAWVRRSLTSSRRIADMNTSYFAFSLTSEEKVLAVSCRAGQGSLVLMADCQPAGQSWPHHLATQQDGACLRTCPTAGRCIHQDEQPSRQCSSQGGSQQDGGTVQCKTGDATGSATCSRCLHWQPQIQAWEKTMAGAADHLREHHCSVPCRNGQRIQQLIHILLLHRHLAEHGCAPLSCPADKRSGLRLHDAAAAIVLPVA